MGFGVSLLLLAAGAVPTFAIEVDESNGLDLDAIGIILMVVGAIGLIASLAFWSSWGGYRPGGYRRRRVIEEEDI
jgi:hypothetical protein